MRLFTFLVEDQELEALWDMPSNLSEQPPGYEKGRKK